MTRLSRRDLLKRVGAAGAGALATPAFAPESVDVLAPEPQSPAPSISLTGRDVEVIVTSVSDVTARVTVVPVSAERSLDIAAPAFSVDGSLVSRTWPAPVARIAALAERRTIPAGHLHVVVTPREVRQSDVTAFGIQVQADNRPPFALRVDERTGAVMFSLGGGAILGLGEGGPQFDRRGSADRMRSGQGGYHLRTHGGRVPDAVAHRHRRLGDCSSISPAGTFDFTGAEARFDPVQPPIALPLDIFVVGANDPAALMARVRALHRLCRSCRRCGRFGYQQSHRTLASREEILQEAQDVSREEAAVRHPDLSRHRLLSVGLEHRQRRVHLQLARCFRIRRR